VIGHLKMQKNSKSYTHYRTSNIGRALEESLEDLQENGKISSSLSKSIFEQFDKSVNDGLGNSKNKMSFKGHCHTYRYAGNLFSYSC
jgi:transcription initiation factor TFIIA small subunit